MDELSAAKIEELVRGNKLEYAAETLNERYRQISRSILDVFGAFLTTFSSPSFL